MKAELFLKLWLKLLHKLSVYLSGFPASSTTLLHYFHVFCRGLSRCALQKQDSFSGLKMLLVGD